MKKVKWGIISTAKIGIEKVIPGLQSSGHCEVHAIASRSQAGADEQARRLGIPRAYGSYEALLADPEIEAIYNPLPNHLHVPWTLEAAAAGKHVLCEKPVAITAEEAAQLRTIPEDVIVMEAFMVRFHPQWHRVKALIAEGAVGTPRAIQVFFSYYNDDPDNIRNKVDIGGGAALDIGCYPLVVSRFLFDAEPLRVVSLVDRDPQFGTDRTMSAVVDFGEGRHLTFTVSTQAALQQRAAICGTQGRIEVQIPFNPPGGSSAIIRVDDCSALDGSSTRTETIRACDQYAEQGDAFSRAVRGEQTLPYGVEDAIRSMQILDALFRSEKSMQWESVKA